MDVSLSGAIDHKTYLKKIRGGFGPLRPTLDPSMPLLQHVVHEHKILKKPKISEYFIVTFVEQPSYDYLDICEDKWLNKISASINKHRIILPRIK